MTAPLTPPDCDLQNFAFMPLDARRLRDSDLASRETPEACWAALLLWCASWHQVPAASLPNDDRVLANLAGYGRVVAAWMAVKEGALRGFVLCDDGRLYHPVVAEKALEAWKGKLEQLWRTECARIKKHNQRHGADLPCPSLADFLSERVHGDDARTSLGTPSGGPRGHGESSLGTSPNCPQGQDQLSHPCPSGNDIQRERDRERKEEKISDADASSGGSAEPTPPGLDLLRHFAERTAPQNPRWSKDELFKAAWSACTDTMRRRSDSREKTWPIWARAAVRAGGPDLLLAALKAYLAGDKDVQRTGGPGFHLWLKDGKWEHWLPKAAAEGEPAVVWAGPADARAAMVTAKGEAWVASYIDRCLWRAEERLLVPHTAFAARVIATEVGHVLREFGLSIDSRGQRGAA